MGLITQAIERALPPQKAAARRADLSTTSDGTMATASRIDALRRVGPQGAPMYRNWAIHGELVRAAFDIKLGELTSAEWELVPFDNQARPPDKGLMNRMREILMMPNPGEVSTGSFMQAIGEDLLTLDAGTFEKERTLKGEVIWLWPVDGAAIKVDRFWAGDPKAARYYFNPRADVMVPLYNFDIGYLKVHDRSYSPLGIPPLETLRMTIEAELNGSMYNSRQVTQAAPDGIMDLGETARPDQVESFKSIWNTLIAGKSMMAFWGGTKNAKFIPFKTGNREMQFMEWQEYCVRKLCAVIGIAPQQLGFTIDVNKSTGEVQQGQTDDRSSHLLVRSQEVMTSQFCWDPGWGGPSNNIAFRYRSVSQRTSKALAETHKLTLAGMPEQSINEARRDSGLPPIGDPNAEENPFNKLMANTPQGLVLLDKIPSAYDLAMRETKPPDGGGDSPPPQKQIKDMFEALSTTRDSALLDLAKSHSNDLLQLSAAIAGREINVEAGTTIEPGAVVVHTPSVQVDSPVTFEPGAVQVKSDVHVPPQEIKVDGPTVNVDATTKVEPGAVVVEMPEQKSRKVVREKTFTKNEDGQIVGSRETEEEL